MKLPRDRPTRPLDAHQLDIIDQDIKEFTKRYEKPTLASIARVCGRASRLLRISDLDERMACENAATIQLAERLHLIKA